jgi:hypothetical protein
MQTSDRTNDLTFGELQSGETQPRFRSFGNTDPDSVGLFALQRQLSHSTTTGFSSFKSYPNE